MLSKKELIFWIIIFFILIPTGTPEDAFTTIPLINFFNNISPGNGLMIYMIVIAIFLIILFVHLKENGMTFKGFFKAGKKLVK